MRQLECALAKVPVPHEGLGGALRVALVREQARSRSP